MAGTIKESVIAPGGGVRVDSGAFGFAFPISSSTALVTNEVRRS